MPPGRSHAEASRLRARQSRIAKDPGPPVHLLRPCNPRNLALSRVYLRVADGFAPPVLYVSARAPRRRRPRRLRPRDRARLGRALSAERGGFARPDRAGRSILAGGLPARRAGAGRRNVAAVLALLRLPEPGSRDRSHRPPRGGLGGRAVPRGR